MSHLRANPDNWFPEEAIQALKRVQNAMSSGALTNQLADELKAGGYSPSIGDWDRKVLIHRTSQQWMVTRFFWDLISAIWPQPVTEALWNKSVSELNSADVDALIRFLEIDPYFHRSGYAKPTAISRLARCPLTSSDRKRLAQVLRAIVFSGWDKSVKGWTKIAKLIDERNLHGILKDGLSSPQTAVRHRATWLALSILGQTKRVHNLRYPWTEDQTADWEAAFEIARARFT